MLVMSLDNAILSLEWRFGYSSWRLDFVPDVLGPWLNLVFMLKLTTTSWVGYNIIYIIYTHNCAPFIYPFWSALGSSIRRMLPNVQDVLGCARRTPESPTQWCGYQRYLVPGDPLSLGPNIKYMVQCIIWTIYYNPKNELVQNNP